MVRSKEPGFLIETDVQSVQDARIPVYAFKDDLDRRGIREDELVRGIKIVPREQLGKLVAQVDTVWNW